MKYISTRGEAPTLGFCDTLLTGLARDGGLYLPQSWPQFDAADFRKLRGKPFADVAVALLTPFIGNEIAPARFERIVRDSYATFRHEAVCPLVQTGANTFVLELFHGPTLAFKDVAMQLIARLMDHVLAERGERATIVGATSGDTGAAAVQAFAGRERADIFILFPKGRVSPVQQRQMTGATEGNVHVLAIEGTFDDCQAIVKNMFLNSPFRDQIGLAGINSINFARVMAQIVYYVTAALSLGAPDRAVSFTVPTGNFGDIFAGYAAKRMGLPIEKLVIATNDNDILARTLAEGRYAVRGVVATTSPSMDIQVSSNFERLLFEAGGREAAPVRQMMASLKQSGSFDVPAATLAAMRKDFAAGRATMAEADLAMAEMVSRNGYVIDPHTACGVHVAAATRSGDAPIVVLSTAHPAKFPDAVEAATGRTPALPAWLGGLMQRKERLTGLPCDQKIVENHVLRLARANE